MLQSHRFRSWNTFIIKKIPFFQRNVPSDLHVGQLSVQRQDTTNESEFYAIKKKSVWGADQSFTQFRCILEHFNLHTVSCVLLCDWMFHAEMHFRSCVCVTECTSHFSQRIRYLLMNLSVLLIDDSTKGASCPSKLQKCFNCESRNTVCWKNEWDFYSQSQRCLKELLSVAVLLTVQRNENEDEDRFDWLSFIIQYFNQSPVGRSILDICE